MPNTIDVYERYQGAINWPQVAASGVRNVFVKLTNGASPAATSGDTYVNGARAAGLRIGGYAYVLGSATPEAQADAFADELLRLGALDLAPACDFEDASLPTEPPARRTWIAAFLGRLKTRIPDLARVLAYSSGSELQQMQAWLIAVTGVQVLAWDGEYGPNDGAEHPIVHYTGSAAIHQFTSVGRVPGISTPVDLDDVTTDISAKGAAVAYDQANYNQLTGSTVEGEYPGWPTYRYDPIPRGGAEDKLTLVNYARAIDREVNSRLKASDRATADARPDDDTLFGQATSGRAAAEQAVTMLTSLSAKVDGLAGAQATKAEYLAAVQAGAQAAVAQMLAASGSITITAQAAATATRTTPAGTAPATS